MRSTKWEARSDEKSEVRNEKLKISSHVFRLSSSSGFTLIEVMIAMAILAVMAVLIYSSMTQTIKGKDDVEKRDELGHSANLTLNKMVLDLQMAFLLNGPDFLGSDGKIKVVFIGKEDRLDFASLSHVRYFKDAKEADYAEIGYFLEDDKEEPNKKNLMRRESKVIDDKPLEGGSVEMMVEDVKEFHLEYYDPSKKEWLKNWDSTQVDFSNRLPRAVRISLKVQDPSMEEPYDFSTVADLKMLEPINF